MKKFSLFRTISARRPPQPTQAAQRQIAAILQQQNNEMIESLWNDKAFWNDMLIWQD